jgi:hypothetical protein
VSNLLGQFYGMGGLVTPVGHTNALTFYSSAGGDLGAPEGHSCTLSSSSSAGGGSSTGGGLVAPERPSDPLTSCSRPLRHMKISGLLVGGLGAPRGIQINTFTLVSPADGGL